MKFTFKQIVIAVGTYTALAAIAALIIFTMYHPSDLNDIGGDSLPSYKANIWGV